MTDLAIFDCDGVLVDSDRISLPIQAQHLRELGLEISVDEWVRDFLGLGMPTTLRLVGDRLGRPVPDVWSKTSTRRFAPPSSRS